MTINLVSRVFTAWSSSSKFHSPQSIFMDSKLVIGLSAVLATVSLGYLYADSLAFLFGYWIGSEDYSHGMFVPLISLFLIWQTRHRIAAAGTGNSWWGLAVILTGLFLYWIGELATLYVLQHMSLWMVIVGLVIASIGLRRARAITFPLSYLFGLLNFFFVILQCYL